MKPRETPIGLLLAQTAKVVGQAFDDTLAAAGGSTSTWLVLLALMRGSHRTQRDLAAEVGVRGPTLTHHLNGMEQAGLLTRARRPDNRREHEVALTDGGRALFHRLRSAAAAHDVRLRQVFDPHELETLRALLGRMAQTVRPPASAGRGLEEA
ncbi:MAG TPA: MarR family winged helix-turn-helix transcriptional regulator [Aliidongia sp.]|uniref:MarR family winged helix-turn-helix transcriptional regulator n=1 Tax=Aliidongia sp. TaxID=1914230 RepID=UPI002DDD692D|nr:MarR family winged helix-turn-helix transcriptional regulator [Aliidongia sp.]HEV2673001.1 MarR family winged helix-turn-helix transcriptional regulator [Aliidongia sp.]